MTHVRRQIRARFKEAFDTYLSDTYETYASRKSAINHDPDKVVIDMRIMNDQTRQRETMMMGSANARIHVASVYVRVQRSAREHQIDDLLDDDEVQIIKAVDKYEWDDLLEEEPELIQVNFSDDASGGLVLGSMVLRFDVEYRIDRNDPEKIIA